MLGHRLHSEDESRQQSVALRSAQTLHAVLLLFLYDTLLHSIRPSSDSGQKCLAEMCAVETELLK